MSGRMEGRVVAITGGASGIGLATAQLLANEGAAVVIGDLDGHLAAERARVLPGSAAGHQVDVSDEASVSAFFDVVSSGSSRLDALVHCAGIGGVPAPIVDMDADNWRHVVDVNLTGSMLVVKHAARCMADGGAVVAIASLNAVQAARGLGAYAAAKAGLAMLVKVAALELGVRGIRVNALAPGLVATPLSAPLLEPPVVDEFVENTPLGRYGQPDDVAHAALFLVSDESTWMTGDLIAVDGGARLQRYPDLLAMLSAQSFGGH